MCLNSTEVLILNWFEFLLTFIREESLQVNFKNILMHELWFVAEVGLCNILTGEILWLKHWLHLARKNSSLTTNCTGNDTYWQKSSLWLTNLFSIGRAWSHDFYDSEVDVVSECPVSLHHFGLTSSHLKNQITLSLFKTLHKISDVGVREMWLSTILELDHKKYSSLLSWYVGGRRKRWWCRKVCKMRCLQFLCTNVYQLPNATQNRRIFEVVMDLCRACPANPA